MNGTTRGSATAVYMLFFLLSLIEAVRHGDWIMVAVFVALGILSISADLRGAKRDRIPGNP